MSRESRGRQSEADREDPEEAGTRLFAAYETRPAFFDEMFEATGVPRAHCRELCEALDGMRPAEIAAMQDYAERSFLHQGITFAVYGEEGAQERIIPIDFLPRLLDAADWDLVERGLRQRLEALNLFLADVYGPGRILEDGVVPVDLVRGCPQYRVEMRGLEVPHGVYVALCGTDIVRTNDGFVVLEDNLRTLAELAPPGVSNPCIVLLTPGVYNSAFYEHMFLAQEMGVELVQGSDLRVHNGFVYMRTTAGLKKVDVIYRRIDDDFIDPLAFRPDSQLGTPGLFYAYKLGNVTIANAPGTGVADDKSVYAYVPDMIRYYLSEEPLLSNVETHLCRNPEALEYTLDNLETLIVKMPVLDLSVSPCLTPSGAAPRHVDLRPFVLRGNETRLVPGAFCRVALVEGSLVVNSSQGGGGKDLWVLSD
ncbi:Uncharacterized protein sll0335 [Geodia barretti]|uniref:Uncharacterized protein sll0335 n=1 Tax=Geodia barretti TaxID=519541 RepID=A0AA35TSV6_GEOBA|nr:Uncharacterized protein sll0335 [Geodia barretti]